MFIEILVYFILLSYSKLFQGIFNCILNNKNIKNVQGK